MEDLHWSDDTSLEFLHYLARRCVTHPLLVLLTYRSDEVRSSLRHWLAQLDREHLTQEVALTRLTRSDTDAMLRAIFDLQRPVPVETLDALYGLTEGNPFFIEEILKSLIATGGIFYAHGAWDRKPLGELHIPRSIQDAVQQRSDHLSASARQVLILAAVAGRRFDFAVLQQLTHHDEQQLLILMKELMAVPVVTSLADVVSQGETALSLVREIGQRSGEAYTLFCMALCLGSRGEYARALEVAQQSLDIAKEIEHRQWMTGAHWTLGSLYLDLLSLPEAQQHLEQALVLVQEIGSLYWIGLVSASLAEVSIQLNDLAHAEALLTTAFASTETIAQLAATIPDTPLRNHFLHEATALIPRQEPLSPRRAAKKAFGGLTEREREMASLIAQGKSNREIADILVVNYRTIEKHIENVLSKLGFVSRTQIAVWASEKGLGKKEQS